MFANWPLGAETLDISSNESKANDSRIIAMKHNLANPVSRLALLVSHLPEENQSEAKNKLLSLDTEQFTG
ncbi:hypothetical protein AAF463_24120 (plasmid) [Pantoea sp. BJ2]|uniref:Uncharacterized protein n=1 Tax=Pantoea sp. BJ2 TaxID=3141322 RepID=A0AAU7U3Z3_9GAMM